MKNIIECPGSFEVEIAKGFKIAKDDEVSPDDKRARYDSLMATMGNEPQCFAKRFGLKGGAGVCGLCCHIVAIGKPKKT